MLTFREMTLADKPEVDRLSALENDRLCEHCFADIFIWRGHYNTQIAFWNDFCLLRMQNRADGSYAWLPPSGRVIWPRPWRCWSRMPRRWACRF